MVLVQVKQCDPPILHGREEARMTSASPADMTSWHLQNQLDQRAAEQVVKTKRTEQITLPSNMDLTGITSYGKQAKQTLQLCS